MLALEETAAGENSCTTKDGVESKALKKRGFFLDKVIGEGSYATVRLAHHTEISRPLAVKVIQKERAPTDFLDRFLPRELEVMCKLRHHPNIISLYRVIDVNKHVYIFMEFAEHGDLLDFIKNGGPMSDVAARTAFNQLVSALRYCHSLNIAHRDLKCENILLDHQLNIKLTDFGFARKCSDANSKRVLSDTYCGSSAYAAPEVLQGIPYNPKMYDVWSSGIILYIMVCGSMPYDDSNMPRMLKTMLSRQITFPSAMSNRIHPHCKSLILHILQPDVTRRATIEQIRASAWLMTPIELLCTDEENLYLPG